MDEGIQGIESPLDCIEARQAIETLNTAVDPSSNAFSSSGISLKRNLQNDLSDLFGTTGLHGHMLDSDISASPSDPQISQADLRSPPPTSQIEQHSNTVVYTTQTPTAGEHNTGSASYIRTVSNITVLQRLEDAKKAEIMDLQTEHAIVTMRLANAQQDLNVIQQHLREMRGQ